MNTPLTVSVIIPVYNAEKYLKACIDSVLNQTYKHIEIIAIDDGSTDQSLEILKEYESLIQVISKENEGTASTRNLGIKKSKEGKYIISANPVIYEFEITKTIKGKIKKEIVEIASAESGASCGYNFEIGKSYLVYARKSNQYSSKTKNESDFVTSLCDRNQKLKNVDKKEFQELEKLKHRKGK